MVRIPYFHCCGPNSVPGQGADILQSTRRDQKKKKKERKKIVTHMVFSLVTIVVTICMVTIVSPDHIFGKRKTKNSSFSYSRTQLKN